MQTADSGKPSGFEADAVVPAPVLPLVTAEKAAEQWALFEALKTKLLSERALEFIIIALNLC